jgi:glucokinase
MKEVVVGIDIGGTFTKYGIVDRNGNCLAENSVSTDFTEDVNEYLENLYKNITKTFSQFASEYEIKGIGIGAPNANYYNGTIEYAPNLKWKGVVPMAKLVQNYFKVPVALTNDANAAAIGEMLFGGAKGMKDFIVITLGTGLGSGIVVNGEVVYGHDGFAGELGHIIVRPDGRSCGCGRTGCLEAYASATGIRRTVYKLLADSLDESELRSVSFNQLSAEMISKYAKRGDKIAIQAFEYTGQILGQKLADVVASFSPEAIFLFGGLAKAGDFILQPTKKYMEANMMPIFRGKVKLLISGLKEVNAAVMGSSALIWKELEK